MGEKTEKLMAAADEHLIRVYNRFPVAFSGGKGMYLTDVEGKQYLDFASGIGVNAFGANDEEFTEAIRDQVGKVLHTSNLYYHEPLAEAAQRLSEVSGLDKVFFTNSGAEAIEGALKTAKRYYYNRTGKNDAEVIAMKHSFHGRTVGSLSVTGTDEYRAPFYPLMSGVAFADFNDLSSVEEAVTDGLVRMALSSVADMAIIPLQDYLHLDGSARVNTPSTLGKNWMWRMPKGAATKALAKQMHAMAEAYGRA